MKLNHYDHPWPLKSEGCPCDLHFIQYLEAKKLEGKLIFHFGTGEHHLVGKNNHERGNLNEIIAITACKEEHDVYIDFITNNPVAANYYKVLFGDIYTLSQRILPTFDIVTLFHLCEYYDEHEWETARLNSPQTRLNSAYARLNDWNLLEIFLSKLNSGGKILFYKRSNSFSNKAAKVIDNFISQRRLIIEGEYKTLLIAAANGD